MKVRVDSDRCQGHTLCNIAAPDIFKPREEDGHAFVDESGINSGSEQAIWDAQATCPEQAIEVTED